MTTPNTANARVLDALRTLERQAARPEDVGGDRAVVRLAARCSPFACDRDPGELA